MKVLNDFDTLTLIQIFWKTKTFLRLNTHHLYSKLLRQKPMLKQIEWRLQNGPITTSGVLPVTTLFLKIIFSFRTS